MKYEDFIAQIRESGLGTRVTKRILYVRIPNPPYEQLLVRWGKDANGSQELLCYIDMRFRADGKLEDIYCVPLKDVTPEMVSQFVNNYRNLYENTLKEYQVTYYDSTSHDNQTLIFSEYMEAVETANALNSREDVKFVSMCEITKNFRIVPDDEWLNNACKDGTPTEPQTDCKCQCP